MKVKYKRTGGFAPMVIGVQLDTDKCPADLASQLEQLIDSSDIMNVESAQVKNARDVRSHHLEITKDDRKKNLIFDEISVPDQAKALIDFLQAHSESLLPD